MRRPTLITLAAAVMLSASTASATHPDNEGERGLELSLSLGGGGFSNTDERIFYRTQDIAPSNPALEAFTGGLAAQAQLGWRFNPVVSAGLQYNYQSLSATGNYSNTEANFGARDTLSSYHFGVYARFYPLALRAAVQHNRRVFFNGYGDLRRLEPWLSVGVGFAQSISRDRSYTEPQNRTSWVTSGVAVPIGLGAEYRLTQPLAVGVQLSMVPITSASTQKDSTVRVVSSGSDQLLSSSVSYDPVRGGNFQFFFGLSARYTFTFF
ncbi:MAG: hypothetical protein JNK72_17980 [Myxococcales bacterium]|nr:hypothetical protein [Myxococcales bacterium]